VAGPHVWRLVEHEERQIAVKHEPLIVADRIGMIHQAAISGLGIAQLPLSACLSDIQQGHLELVLPDFPAPLWEIQVVFASKRGLLPAVRSFIDFLVAHSVSEVPEGQIKRHTVKGSRETVRFWTSREPLHRLAASS
jgi:DNA-binding transcriptional LysR family regulator